MIQIASAQKEKKKKDPSCKRFKKKDQVLNIQTKMVQVVSAQTEK